MQDQPRTDDVVNARFRCGPVWQHLMSSSVCTGPTRTSAWEVEWRAVQEAGYSGLHVPRYRCGDDAQRWWSRLDCDCDCIVAWDLSVVREADGPFKRSRV